MKYSYRLLWCKPFTLLYVCVFSLLVRHAYFFLLPFQIFTQWFSCDIHIHILSATRKIKFQKVATCFSLSLYVKCFVCSMNERVSVEKKKNKKETTLSQHEDKNFHKHLYPIIKLFKPHKRCQSEVDVDVYMEKILHCVYVPRGMPVNQWMEKCTVFFSFT